MAETFHCSVVTPERAILECDAASAVFPAHDGEIGILPRRAPLLCRLGTGTLRVKTDDGVERSFYVDGGFGQMVDNKLTLLTEQARAADDIDLEAARQALKDAQALPVEDGYDQRQAAIQRARVQVKLAEPESPY